eukprot:gene30438-39681_t
MVNVKSCDSENDVTQPFSEAEASSSSPIAGQDKQEVENEDHMDTSLAYTNENFGYRSYREELWTKPARENYHISSYVSEEENISWPMTKKQYDVILHTVKNIRQHGEQFEILLKVKHADDDSNFDFLNIDSPLYALFQLLKVLEEKIFWHVFLGRDRAEIEMESEVIDSTINGQVNALQLLGSMYDDDASDNATDSDEIVGNLIGSGESNSAVTDVLPDVVIPLDRTESIDVPKDAADAKEADGFSDAKMDNRSLTHEGGSSVEQDTVAANLPHDQEEPTNPGVAKNSANFSISSDEGESEETCKTETNTDGFIDPEYDPINDDDLLDEDVDENKPWGVVHLKKKEFERRQVQLARLAKAKEMRQRFSMVVGGGSKPSEGSSSDEMIADVTDLISKEDKDPDQIATVAEPAKDVEPSILGGDRKMLKQERTLEDYPAGVGAETEKETEISIGRAVGVEKPVEETVAVGAEIEKDLGTEVMTGSETGKELEIGGETTTDGAVEATTAETK